MSRKQTSDVQNRWGMITIKEQRRLIFQFLKQSPDKSGGAWMEFLHNRFGLENGKPR